MSARVRLGSITALAFLLQVSLFNDLRIGGVAAELLLLMTIVVAYQTNAETGAFVGFAGGLLFDLVQITPLGLTAATYVLTAYVVGSFKTGLGDISWPGRALGVFSATTFGLGLFVLLGEVMGQDVFGSWGRLLRVMLLAGVWNLVLAVPIGAMTKWAVPDYDATSARHLSVVE